MNPWEVLGIVETNNKTEIKKAYTKILKIHHPEDDPGGFMVLRQAYESALKQCEVPIIKTFQTARSVTCVKIDSDTGHQLDESTEISFQNTSGISLYSTFKCFGKIDELYNDVFKRYDISNWRKLLLEFNMDEFQQLNNKACDYFNEHYNLPQDVWKLLDEEFMLCNNDNFRWSNFVNYDYGLSIEYYDRNIVCDYNKYERYRFFALEAFMQRDYLNAIKKSLEAVTVYKDDPVLYRITGVSYYMTGDYSNSITSFSKVLELNNNDTHARLYRGSVYLRTNELALAYTDFNKVLECNPENLDAGKGLIKCLLKLQKKQSAYKYVKEYAPKNPTDLELYEINYKLETAKFNYKIKKWLKSVRLNGTNEQLIYLAFGLLVIFLIPLLYLLALFFAKYVMILFGISVIAYFPIKKLLSRRKYNAGQH